VLKNETNMIFKMLKYCFQHTAKLYFHVFFFFFLGGGGRCFLDYDYITLLRTGSGYIGRSARLGLELSPFCGK
jgi:hypothetical protein